MLSQCKLSNSRAVEFQHVKKFLPEHLGIFMSRQPIKNSALKKLGSDVLL